MRILSFGSGLDSSAIALRHLFETDLGIDHVIMADTGAEKAETMANAQLFKQMFGMAGIPFTIVRKDGENIIEFLTRLGCVPLMPGSSHTCSMKFKAEVIQKFVRRTYPGELNNTYLIGIEANEERRSKRFSKPKGDGNSYEYPLMNWGWTRADCDSYLKSHGVKVVKSSCQVCPFMQPEEIADARRSPETWKTIELVERRFSEESSRKHQAWIEAGKPLRSDGKCGPGHWRKDSWGEGARLFSKRLDGSQLSVNEWANLIDTGVVTGCKPDHFVMDREAVLEKARDTISSRIANGDLKPPKATRSGQQLGLFDQPNPEPVATAA